MPTSDLEFREIPLGDLPLCAELMMATPPWSILHFTLDACLDALGNPRVNVIGAFRGDRLLGFVAMLAEGIEFEPLIVFLCVDEDHRSTGIGSALVDHFERSHPDAANLYLFVSDVNPNAQRLYQRLGYAQIGAMANFNLVGQTEFLYRKTRRPLITAPTTAPAATP